jgi:spermidine/putrescine transport system substrate-binding protein
MHKLFLGLIALFLIVALVLPGMSQAQDDELEPWTCPEGFEGQTLSVYNWSTYIAEDTIPNFEELCGVTVEYDIFESNESMLARIREGNPGYDIVVPTDYTVAIMIADGLLVPLDLDKIPNFAHIADEFKNPPFDPNNQYSIPYQWGTIGIGYNVNEVEGEVTSWQDIFEHDGPVAWLEDARAMISFGLLMVGHDPNSADPDEIEEAMEYLIDHSENLVAIAPDDGQVLLERGDVDMTIEYSGDIFQIMDECECEDYTYVIPEDGSLIWVDNLAIPVDAPNVELAHVFIDYVLHPAVGAEISNYTAYGSPNATAIEMGLIDPEYLEDPSIYPDEETLERLYFIRENAEFEQFYLDAWDEIVIFAGSQ